MIRVGWRSIFKITRVSSRNSDLRVKLEANLLAEKTNKKN